MATDETTARRVYFTTSETPITNRLLLKAAGRAVGRVPRFVPVPRFVLKTAMLAATAASRIIPFKNQLDRKQYEQMVAPSFVCTSARLTADTGWRRALPRRERRGRGGGVSRAGLAVAVHRPAGDLPSRRRPALRSAPCSDPSVARRARQRARDAERRARRDPGRARRTAPSSRARRHRQEPAARRVRGAGGDLGGDAARGARLGLRRSPRALAVDAGAALAAGGRGPPRPHRRGDRRPYPLRAVSRRSPTSSPTPRRGGRS